MKVEVNLNKKYFLFVLVGIFILAGIIATYALAPGVKPNPGHDINEVAPPASCTTGQVLQWSGSAWSCVSNGASSYTRRVQFDKAGTYNFIVPSGVTNIRVIAVGSGGGGTGFHVNSGSNTPFTGAGGGSGGVSISTLTVASGSTHTVVVGAGGSAGWQDNGDNTRTTSNGGNGAVSKFDNSVIANGGGGALMNTGFNTSPEPGGAAGVGTGDITYTGGAKSPSYPSPYKSDGANSQYGSSGGLAGTYVGNPGTMGSGGGGALQQSSPNTATGGKGGDGLVVIEY